MHHRYVLLLIAATFLGFPAVDVGAVNIVLDYTYDLDNSDFFGAGNPDEQGGAAKDAVEAAADFFSGILNDSLSAITVPDPYEGILDTQTWTWDHTFENPGAAGTVVVTDANISADEYRIYVGGKSLGGTTAGQGGPGGFGVETNSTGGGMFFPDEVAEIIAITDAFSDAVENREKPTGFANWGGATSFDNDGSTVWHYDRNTTMVASGKIDFFSVALHEIGHALGLNGSVDEWNALQVGAEFQGPAALAAWKAEDPDANMSATGIPTESAGDHHWRDNNVSPPFDPAVRSYVVGTTDLQEVAMDPSIFDGERKLFTNVDALALEDIGWDVVLAPPIGPGDMNGDGSVSVADAGPFILALTNRAAYEVAYPMLDADMLGDVDESGTFDLGDLSLFSSLIAPEPGDMNGDGSVTLADAELFVLALIDRVAYEAQGYGIDADLAGDVDGSGTFDLGDLGAFSALLGGPASAATVPEPGTAALLVVGLALVAGGRRGGRR